jgi:hypothetical protein
MKIDWSKLTPREVACALRTIPKLVAYAWKQDSDGNWLREDCEEYGCARGASVYRRLDNPHNPPGPPMDFCGPPYDPQTGEKDPFFSNVEDAKAAYDRWLVANGWLLDDTDDGSGDPNA